ncbi:MAG: DRTGG domain-containing protein [Clostridium sp.]|uniref:DRTGG domain-containing protein n=1 Tax=Clostridium sp. TaxID=1506 RepID=UPI00302E32C1
MSKHEEIIRHILSLEIGTKISVRGIASDLGVSEGTAYRAIKECETIGIVNTIPRVGTVRVEKIEKKRIDRISFKEIANIVDGTLLGGKAGDDNFLERFVIGAMEIDTMKRYISPGALLIVGNREEAHRLALENKCAVLITGGFNCSPEIKALADENELPVISCTYDTFTVASLINKAIYENNVKKEIVLVEDVMAKEPCSINSWDKVVKLRELGEKTSHERYPVIDEETNVVGVVSITQIKHNNDSETISNIMTKNPIVLIPTSTVAYAAHIMAWEGIKICPVVHKNKLVGVITREDVIKAMQIVVRQPQVGQTLDDLILKNFEFESNKDTIHFWGEIIPEMLDSIGTASWNALNMLLSTMGTMALRQNGATNVAIDSFTAYFTKPVQIGRVIDVYSEVLDRGRYYAKVEVTMYNQNKELMGKAIMSAKMLKR